MKPKTLLVLGAAAGGTALATGGVAVALMGGPGGAAEESVRPAASAEGHRDAGEIASVLRRRGAVGCEVGQSRAECRFNDRYVAAQVLEPGMSMPATLASWKSGTAQAMTGDRGSFAILRGPNWLVTGPDEFVGEVRDGLGGQLIYCDRPYSTCK